MIESWDWLIQLVEAGSFRRASEKLHISQQTLSARLAALEKELETKLVVRSAPLALTRAGEAFLTYAYEQNEAHAIMMRRVGEVTAGGAGKLKVGVSNIRSRVLMPHVIKQFHRSMPGVSVKIIESTNEELVGIAERGEADLVIAQFNATHPGVVVRPLFQEEIVLAATPSLLEKATGLPALEAARCASDQGLGILKNCPFLLTSLDDVSGRIARIELRTARIKPESLVESDSMMTLLALGAAGIGGVFCPSSILDAAPDLSQGFVRIPLSDGARYEISLGRPANAEPWTPAQVFEDVVGALFGDSRPKENERSPEEGSLASVAAHDTRSCA